MLLVKRLIIAKPQVKRGAQCHPMTARDASSGTSRGFSAGHGRLLEPPGRSLPDWERAHADTISLDDHDAALLHLRLEWPAP